MVCMKLQYKNLINATTGFKRSQSQNFHMLIQV
jgi:hypothetical protein